MVVVWKLSQKEGFVLQMNDSHICLPLTVSFSHEFRFMTFTALCCEHSGFYQLQKVRALCELMQSHLCPAMDPILVQPHITRPLPPSSSDLGVCPDQTPTLLSTQLTLLSTELTHLLQPFTDTPPPTSPPSTTTFTKQLQVLKQTGFFAVCSHQPLKFICTPTRCPAVLALWGSFLTPVCLYILVPLSQSQGAVPQDTEGRSSMGPAIPSCSSRGRGALCLPPALSGRESRGSTPGSGRSPGEENGNPLQYSCLENLMDRGTWQATVHGVARVRQTRLSH